MFFKCKNCGGNVVYSPEKRKMFCPFCESEDSQELQDFSGQDMTVCPNCGGRVPVQEHTSATRCPYCSSYLILNERVEGDYLPRMMIPFQMGKEVCKNAIREKFKKCVFAPSDFLSEVRLNSMQGTYVPFWFYDYDVNADYEGEGTKARSWTTGDVRYTETSYYRVCRNMDVEFRNIPIDASIQMPDDVMDLMEPFGYDQLTDFKPEFLSGFYAEKYNMGADLVESRAKQKMTDDTNALMRDQCRGYGSLRPQRNNVAVKRAERKYGLLPVWKYIYCYRGKNYPFYVNGQTGKIVGTAPISAGKVWAYAGTLWLCLMIILTCIF